MCVQQIAQRLIRIQSAYYMESGDGTYVAMVFTSVLKTAAMTEKILHRKTQELGNVLFVCLLKKYC